ncbi:hypothetical protein C8R45DRAFT_274224 [Mycena sanguinolenta]|nr:hypothetical protein C8R45DRAFT_274224 [Mycena sanguinolenta]
MRAFSSLFSSFLPFSLPSPAYYPSGFPSFFLVFESSDDEADFVCSEHLPRNGDGGGQLPRAGERGLFLCQPRPPARPPCPSEVASGEALVEKFCAVAATPTNLSFALFTPSSSASGSSASGTSASGSSASGSSASGSASATAPPTSSVDLSKHRLRSTHPGTRRRDARRAGRDGCERAGCAAGRVGRALTAGRDRGARR